MANLSLFGWEILRKKIAVQDQPQASFVAKQEDDGAVVISAAAAYGTYVDLDGTVRTEAELINRYREMSLHAEIDSATDEIVNEAITTEEEEVVKINLDNLQKPNDVKAIKDAVGECWEDTLKLLDFRNNSYKLFKRWYIDGRLYFHVIIDPDDPKQGIKELRYIDPRKIRKIREVIKKNVKGGDVTTGDAITTGTKNEYYIYNEKGFNTGSGRPVGPNTTGLKIAKDSIVFVTSGLTDVNGTMVLSYLHKAIKPLNQLRTLEDANVIYCLSRAPERRVWYIDVGNLPKMKAEQYVRDIMVKHKNRLIYDAASGEVRDDRKFMCFSLNTKIPLLDGRILTLQNLIDEYQAGKKNWVYSCDPTTGKFAPGPVSWAGITKKNTQVVRVTFDNGKSVVCTPDHKFPVWGKGLVEAQNLVGQSVIPGYRRMKELLPGYTTEYEQIYQNDTKTWKFTHREVARWKEDNLLREEMIYNQQYINDEKKTIHHKDCNKFNNSPENLVMMNRYDHIQYHAENARGKLRPNKSEDFTPEWREKLSIAAKRRIPLTKTWKVTTPNNEQVIIENLSKYCREQGLNRCNIKGKFGSKKFYAEELVNHKAISVEWLFEKIDVGCITVDLEETYHSNHTYLLDAGVYTKNTMLEDYWLPRREGGKGTEVTTLPAGQNLGEMANVEYFLRKLYGALHVPINRLNPDDVYIMGQDLSAGISRDEIKFGKFIGRLRNDFTKLFTKVLITQMVLKQVMTIEDAEKISPDFRFDFSRDNYFLEQKENQILLQRVDIVHQMMDLIGRYFSSEWVVKNVLKQSDEEIEQMRQQITDEMLDPIWNPPPPPEEGDDEEGADVGGDQDKEIQPDPMAQQHLQTAKNAYDALSGGKSKGNVPDYRKAGKAIARNG